MKSAMLAFSVVLGTAVLLSAAEPQVAFEDPLHGKPATGWSWLRENPAAWRSTAAGLEIRVEPGLAHNVKNALLRAAPDRGTGKYAVEVAITFTTPPSNQFEQAGITWYQQGKPVFKLVHEHIDGKDYIIPGKVPAPEKTVRLRLVVSKDKYTAEFQAGAQGEYKTAAAGNLPPGPAEQISIQCYNGLADAQHWIRFEGFRVTPVE
jgi:hypothetical protein